MSRKVSYTEFRKSACRHFEVCDDMLKKLVKSDNFPTGKKKSVLLEIYYLSGYIIECILKFVLFSHLNFKKHDDVYDYKDKDWKNHDFNKLITILNELDFKFSQDIPIIGSKHGIPPKVLKLYSDWSTDYRYVSTVVDFDLQVELVEAYLVNIEKIKYKLFNQYA